MNRNIPSLDGLRAVSIFFVICGHALMVSYQGRESAPKVVMLLLGNGDLGVNVFFGISGFLITHLLKKEYTLTGRVCLKEFYLRRAFRIFPAFYCYLLTVLGLSVLGVVGLFPRTWISAAIYLRNYWPPFEGSGDVFTAHAWSLAVEEQFYLFWPVCFASLGRRKAAKFAVFLIALLPVSRIVTYAFSPGLRADLGYMTHTKGDALMVGCLAALWIDHPRFREALHLGFAWHLPLFCTPFLLIASPLLHERFGGVYYLSIGYSLEAFAIGLTLLWLVECPQTTVGQVLNTTIIKHIGIISYSLYLWQQLFIYGSASWSIPGACWWSILATVGAAEASYWLVERPFLGARDRFMGWRRYDLPRSLAEFATKPSDEPLTYS